MQEEIKASWKLLVVEDNDLDVELLEFYMRRIDMAMPIERATNGEEALHYLTNTFDSDKPDSRIVLLLDLNMPKMNGSELLERIRTEAWFNQIVVYILSTSDQQSDRDQTMRLGAFEYLTKPIDESMLQNILKTHKIALTEIAQQFNAA